MDDVPFISVIVAVYNVGEYLNQCLAALQSQTLSNIEVIVIDDGSTDDSGLICDSFSREDARFRVIHRENGGLSAARNDGLDAARAEYVMFVDGDDWVEPDFCGSPFRAAEETGADVVVFRRVWHADKNQVRPQDPFPVEDIAPKEDVLLRWWPIVGVIVWNKLYRRSLFDGIRFPGGRLSEDTAVTHRLIHRADSVYLLNRDLYHHRVMRPGSITCEKSSRFIADDRYFNLKRLKDLVSWGYDCKGEEVILAMSYLMILGREEELSSRCDEIIRSTDRLVGDSVTRKQRIMFRLYRVSPVLFDVVSRLTGRRIREDRQHRGLSNG